MRNIVIAAGAVGIIVLAIVAFLFLRQPEEASAPIEAVPLELETAAEEEEPTAVPPTPEPEPTATEEASSDEEASSEEEVEEEAEPEPEPTDTPEPEPTDTPVPASSPVLFEIDQSASQVRFELDEDLAGERITVVGTTDQVAGQLAVDLADLSSTQVGVIQINMRTIATDNNFRNRAIQNRILNTNDFEFVTFEPTSVEGLPDSAAVGEAISFTIVGDLTIRDLTTEVVFEVEATAVSETQLSGTASTTVLREAYGLVIPSVPSVANVEEEVELYIDFVANASS